MCVRVKRAERAGSIILSGAVLLRERNAVAFNWLLWSCVRLYAEEIAVRIKVIVLLLGRQSRFAFICTWGQAG